MNDAPTLVKQFARSLQIGAPVTLAGLTVHTISHSAVPGDYLTYAEASEAAMVAIAEVDAEGQVGSLVVINHGKQAVLIIEGEILLGMKQTRVLNVSVLIPPFTRVVVPVSCVEAGRWSHVAAFARRDRFHLSPQVRSIKSRGVAAEARMGRGHGSDQVAVWDAVGHRLERAEVDAPTHSYAELNSARAANIDRLIVDLKPAPEQSGILLVAEGRPLCVDVFDSPATLGKVWEGLIGSYAADSIGRVPAAAITGSEAKNWLSTVARASTETTPAVGLGDVVTIFGPAVAGHALVVDGKVLHLAAGATEA